MWNANRQNETKHFQIIWLIRDLFLENIYNIYKEFLQLNNKNQMSNFKMWEEFEYTVFLQIYEWPISTWKSAQHH